VKIVLQIGMLAMLYLLGNTLVSLLHLPLPGSVVGMLLLFLLLLLGACKIHWVEDGAFFHLKHITLLFIPPIISVVHYTAIFKQEGWKLLIILIVSSFSILLATAYVAECYDKMKRRKTNGSMDD
jgi:holin-like protein